MNVPFLLTGGGFKGFEHGQYRMAAKEITTLANLWATMLQDAGVRIDRFAAANGNTKAIASKHYLQVTEDHFAKAVQIRCSSLPFCLAGGRNPNWPPIRKPLQNRGLRPGVRWCKPAMYSMY